MIKIATIVGARPQFVKAAILSRKLGKYEHVDEFILHTGQHYDANMSDIFFKELGIPAPKYNLGVNQATHGAMTGKMLVDIEKVLIDEEPNMVVVFGDTDSTLAGALAAVKLRIPVAHIEAGLRSFKRAMPEEINRIVSDQIADLLFTPTLSAQKRLTTEEQVAGRVVFSGDIMYDIAIDAVERIDSDSILKIYGLERHEYCLVTLHRAENTDDCVRLMCWIKGLEEIGARTQVIFPLHPRTRNRIEGLGVKLSDFPSINFIDPVGYFEMAALTKNAEKIITDSGGLQKEAFFHKVPCLILRNETEWTELVGSGWSQLVSCDRDSLIESYQAAVRPVDSQKTDFFGDGDAAGIILRTIVEFLENRN
ncbi:MAG: non-hydrolyzing UDP-N-acetylglucosamine 2-epimerase [Opitutales bacterium]